MGRAGRLVYTKQGVPISPTMLPIMMYPNRQDKAGDIQVLLKMKDTADEIPAMYAHIITNFRDHFVGSEVDLKFVEDIPVLPSGKEDYCVSEFDFKG